MDLDVLYATAVGWYLSPQPGQAAFVGADLAITTGLRGVLEYELLGVTR